MKKLIFSSITIILFSLSVFAQDIAPYIKVGETTNSMQQTSEAVINALQNNSFTILGKYNPENKNNLQVIVFTSTDLKNTVVKVSDRGALGAAFKVGLVEKDGKITISYTNPDYFLRAYMQNNYVTFKSVFQKFSADVKTALATLGNEFKPFGGTIAANKIKKYHYKIMMPYFTDPVELNEYSSFEEGLKIIENNLKNHKSNTVLVYKVIYPKEKVAVFGIGLQSKEDGESYFLPKIGEENIAAMPYEIILQGKTVTMLHGKYRLALSWPELSMGTFMKIMSTPGDIEDTLEAVCK
ncbi:MAG: hypothetical protein R3342_05265 [Lutibacter sp.]|uniref:hypothetical protein n=1 Tax=Lutibacter sp. TaxID=1925666 RepID=UPI00299CDCE7|nr:hypothetical protein [Lutibacter sp.]MDX1828940.1 hypothetical protein [Lutibacter sp.]